MYCRSVFTLILLLASLFVATYMQAANDDALKKLDMLLQQRDQYINEKIARIDYLKQLLKSEQNQDKRYNITYQIVEEYSNFQADSAFVYIEKNKEIAAQSKNIDQALRNKFQYVFVSAQSGLLNEAESELRTLPLAVADMTNEQKLNYYRQWQRLYMNLREFSQRTHLEQKYNDLQNVYCDSVLMYVIPNSESYYLYKAMSAFHKTRYADASENLKQYLQKIDTLSNDAARGYFYLSQISGLEGDLSAEKKYLEKSVRADITSAVKQNRSLRVLAQLLYNEGDVKRAYKYLQISLDDANYYNTRLRNTQVAEALPIIEKDYSIERNAQEKKLKIGLVFIVILCVGIIIISIYLYKKRIELNKAKQQLTQTNSELILMNTEMKDFNQELNRLTVQLKESDKVKEKYIGHFLKLCSTYIQNVSEFKKTINRKLKAGQVEDVYNMTLTSRQQTTEFRDFYNEFDRAFINIFPNFVDHFNALLKEDQQFVLKKGDLLNVELRIFALIRLGIKDSSEIAEFLNYTPVTIYSYRTKVKSRAKDKDTFDQKILDIGH